MIYESDYYVGSDLNGDSLSHHGVPHQRWGVKNGPPYPIQKGHEVKYNLGKMTPKTKAGLQKAGKIAGEKVTNAAKTVVKKVNSSFQKWKENKKADLLTKDTDNKLIKNWQRKQLRISDMTDDELNKRIARKRLEEGYRRALRGDFTESKNWKGRQQSKDGKMAADAVLAKIGNAAVEGIAKGITAKISNNITSKAEAKTARRVARADALYKAETDAKKERAEYRARENNRIWKQNQATRYVSPEILRDYNTRLISGPSDMDDYWNRYGPNI